MKKQTPLDELLQATANVHAEREQLRQLIREFVAFTNWLDDDNTTADVQGWIDHAEDLRQRAKEVLGEIL